MTWTTADDLHRTAKALLDSGKASNPEEATRCLESLILQVAVGTEIGHDEAAQAALATIVNAGARAFLGGVHVRLEYDPILTIGWTSGLHASEVVKRLGGRVVDALTDAQPTLAIARASSPRGMPVLLPTWSGWTAAVVESEADLLPGPAITIAGVAAGALGVSDAFQHALGAVVPGRRDVGISLWRPDLPWRTVTDPGPALQYLPAALWLLGLGHLGQGYAWTLGLLPYQTPADVHIGLVDFDRVVKANTATQLLVTAEHVDRRKTRVVADALESLGFNTTIVERAFDEHFRPRDDEPAIALAGFDRVKPRQQLGSGRFARVIDVGLGAGPVEYLDMVVHTFPASTSPEDAFRSGAMTSCELPTAYQDEVARQVREGVDEGVARCGLLEIAGVTVGAAFVGALASTLAVADLLRLLHGGQEFSVISTDLRAPDGMDAVINSAPGDYRAPSFAPAR